MSQAEPTIGIDFGTSYACVAVWQNDRAEVITNEQGNRTTPCCVAYTDIEQLVGEPAFNQLVKNPRNTIWQAKRLLGRDFTEDGLQASLVNLEYTVQDSEGKPMLQVQQGEEFKVIPVEDVCGAVFRLMRETAEAFLGKKVLKAVVALPTYYSAGQRQATIEAAQRGGLEVLRLIHEPTAAAVAYGLDSATEKPRVVLVFDFGATSLDISIMRVDGGLVEMLGTASEASLGGDNIDSILVDHFVKEFKRKHKADLRENPRSLRRLRIACERAKRVLSSSMQTVLEADSLYEGIDFFANITRGRFDELISDVMRRCLVVVDNALQEANVEQESIDEVLLVGGSSRIPRVVATLSGFFPDAPVRTSVSPDEAVACGAATQAFLLASSRSQYLEAVSSHDVLPLSIGMEVADGTFAAIIPRNTPIPCKVSHTMATSGPEQTAVGLRVYEGERLLAKDNTLLGIVSLDGLSPGAGGTAQVDVSFAVDENGTLVVELLDATAGAKATLAITGSTHRLSHAEVYRHVQGGWRDREPPSGDGAESPSKNPGEEMQQMEEEVQDDDMD
eukprot:GGOE01041568.1.p1 GENE.GGOE01041568.1~~GGOE01041568.1.p1  ORF type:complete len:567 (-),score=161.33 GGOE01041568.1:448-2127(-)